MSTELYNKDNSNLDGSTETFSSNIEDKQGRHLWQYVNTTNVSVTITVYGTRKEDSAHNDVVQIGQTPVSSSSVGSGYVDDPWEVAYFEVSYSADPTSGSMEVHQMTEV